MARSGVPNRWKGFAVGIVGGIVGTIAQRYYEQQIAPRYFPPLAPPAYADDTKPDPVEQRAHFSPQYRADETFSQTLARSFYALLHGRNARYAETKQLAQDVAEFGIGIVAGAMYGGTRTTTRPRDFAGGFFYGIRLWLMQTVGAALLGFAPGPTRFSPEQHAHLVTRYWVYSFTTTAVTRLLYRLISPSDWL